jgi:hypothetical protein
MNMTKELSDSLLSACKAAGIESPRYIAQDKSGIIYHYSAKPSMIECEWLYDDDDDEVNILDHPPYADYWRESLIEWVEPQEEGVWDAWDAWVASQGEPLVDVLARHPEHVADDTEMVILYNVADTSKMVDDDCKMAYQNHLRKGNGLCWSRAGDYRAGWQDALAWKGGAHE